MADQGFSGQASVLRRRKDDNPFNFATRTLGTLRENIENVTKKVTIENIASSVSQVTRKKEEKIIIRRAPLGVTQSFSVVLTHVLAPLWAVGARLPSSSGAAAGNVTNTSIVADGRMMGGASLSATVVVAADGREGKIPLRLRDNRFLEFARRLDAVGIDLEKHIDILQQGDESIVTFFIIMLLARLVCLESGSGDYEWPSYTQLVDEVDRRDKKSVSDLPYSHPNDETAVHGQAARKLTEVGGSWKPPGAIELPPQAHAMRHKVLTTLFMVSAFFRYSYNDDHVQCLCDSVSQQLKLLTYSENIVPLIAGVKGPQYVAKFILFQCPEPSPLYAVSDEPLTAMLGSGVGNTAAAVASGILSGLSGGLLGSTAGLASALGGGGVAGSPNVGINPSGPRNIIETAEAGVTSASLQDVTAIALIALRNFIHRNDTSDILVSAIGKAIAISTENNRPSLFAVAAMIMHQSYCVDLRLLAHVMDAARPFIMHKAPVGPQAMKFITQLSELMRNALALPRKQFSSMFVAGREARSFRLQPAHLLTAPYCSRSASFVSSFNFGPIGLSRDPTKNSMLPIYGKPIGRLEPKSGQPMGMGGSSSAQQFFADDATLYIANQCTNIFQALVELSDGNPKIESMDLSRLFSIPPQVLCRYYPSLHSLLLSATSPVEVPIVSSSSSQIQGGANSSFSSQSQLQNTLKRNHRDPSASLSMGGSEREKSQPQTRLVQRPGLTAPSRTPPALVEKIYDLYLTVMDQSTPVRGQKRFRLESPWEPYLPFFINVTTEMDDMNTIITNVMERHWRYCDGRITEKDSGSAYLHPQRDLSLSHFIETDIRLVAAGGTGTFRHIVSAILQLQNLYPGALLRPKLYVLPLGYDNCVASWLALRDPLWRSRIHATLLAEPCPTVDPPSVEAMLNAGGAAVGGGGGGGGSAVIPKNGPPTTIKSLILRNAINDYLLHAKEENKMIAYQAECTAPDGTTSLLLFCCNLEIGTHVNNAVKADPVASAMLVKNSNWGGFENSSLSFVSGNGNASMARFADTPLRGGGAASAIASPAAGNMNYTANSFVGSMAKSFMSGVNALTSQMGSGGKTMESSRVGRGGGGVGAVGGDGGERGRSQGGRANDGDDEKEGPRLTHFINFGSATKSERIDRILIGLHGARGPKLATLKGLNGQDYKHAAIGRDLLDWVSTTYHVFASEEAFASAQAMIDNGLFIPASWPNNSDPMKFGEKNLYTLCPREANDAQPLSAPCSRGLVIDSARLLLRKYLDQIAVREGFRGGGGSGGGLAGGGGDGSPTTAGGAGAGEGGSPMLSNNNMNMSINPNASMAFSPTQSLALSPSMSPLSGSPFSQPQGGGGGGTFGSPSPLSAAAGNGNANLVPTMRCRVSFSGRKGDLRYVDIDEGIATDNATGFQNVSTSLVETHSAPKASATAAGGAAGNVNCPTSVASTVAASLLRDVVSLKLRSTGTPGDKGPAPDPTIPTLHMSVLQPDRKRLSATGGGGGGGGTMAGGSSTNNGRGGSDLAELFDHYQLNFGDRRPNPNATAAQGATSTTPPPPVIMVDTNTVLTIDHERIIDGGAGGGRGRKNQETSNQNDVGLVVCADGDLFGPFMTVRVRPVTINLARQGPSPASGGGGGAHDAASSSYKPAATISVMSYMPASSGHEAVA